MEQQEGVVSPAEIEAEQAVLGSMLLGGMPVVEEVRRIVKAHEFERLVHVELFSCMCRMADEDVPIDAVTLKAKNPTVQAQYIMALGDVVATTAHASGYAKVVHEAYVSRTLAQLPAKIRGLIAGSKWGPAEALAEVQEMVMGISDASSDSDDDMETAVADVMDMLVNPSVGLRTGFSDIDRIIESVVPGDLFVIGGRPGQGKTALSLSVARNVAERQNKKVFFFSFEMTRQQLTARLLASMAQVNSRKFKQGRKAFTPEEATRVATAAAAAAKGKLRIAETRGMKVEELVGAMRIKALTGGAKLFVVDYLQKIRSGRDFGNRENEVAYVAETIKNAAVTLGVPVIALAQLNRGVEHRADKRPSLSDLRDSGVIEQEADIVGLLHSDEETSSLVVPTEFIVEKDRSGEVGTAKIAFHKEFVSFASASKEDLFK